VNSISNWVRAHLVPDARLWWRWWSQRFNAIGLAILAWVQFDPVSVLAVWNMMPVQLRGVLPEHALVGLALVFFALAMLARIVRQPKLEAKP
jgi:hypothetical protein